jgi:hypothetical protein
MQASNDEPTFNHDLLIHPGDARVAHELYPSLAVVLHHRELIDYFKGFNDRADHAKRKSRKLGTCAILLAGAAIVMAAVEVVISALWPVSGFASLTVGLFAAVCGLSSLAVGASGILFGRRKHEWLINRFMGERIRQYHFQSLIAQLPFIIAMASAGNDKNTIVNVRSKAQVTAEDEKPAETNAVDSFLKDRHRRFIEFQSAFEGEQKEAKFESAVGPDGEDDWWLCESQSTFSVVENQPDLHHFFKAYRRLRLQHQLDFTNFKLKSDYKLFSEMPATQADVLADVSNISFWFIMFVHVCVFIIIMSAAAVWTSDLLSSRPQDFQAGSFAPIVSHTFGGAIIILAVVSLCAHAFGQGLQPEREVERYQQYRSTLKSILEQFDGTDGPTEKIKIMRQTERAAFDEMRNFLVTHRRSSFTM